MDGLRGRDETMRRQDYLGARLEIARPEAEQHRVCAVGHPHRVPYAEIGFEVSLKIIHRALQDEPSASGGVTNDAGEGIGAFGVERPPVEERNRQAFPR
jgi:hypothetical protein